MISRQLLGEDEVVRAGVAQEVRALASLQRPLVAGLEFVHVTRSFVCLGQTLAASGDMMHVLQRVGHLPEPTAEFCLVSVWL